MKLKIESQVYSFIWGTKCFIDTMKDVQEDNKEINVTIDVILGSLNDPRVITSLIYNGLKLWCENNNKDLPFEDYNDFLLKYDTIGDEQFYNHIVTDILESSYMGASVVSYLEKKFDVTVTDMNEKKKAKKKYLDALEKSLSTSQAGGSSKVKSINARSQSTKSKDTETN